MGYFDVFFYLNLSRYFCFLCVIFISILYGIVFLKRILLFKILNIIELEGSVSGIGGK